MQLIDLPGIGKKRLSALEAAGIHTPQQLLAFFPRKYVDYSQVIPLAQLAHGQEATVWVRIAASPTEFYKNRRSVTRVQVADASGGGSCVWFHQPYIKHKLHTDDWLRLYGRATRLPGRGVQLVSPRIVEEQPGLYGVYPNIEGVSQKLLRQWIVKCLPLAQALPDPLPEFIRRQYQLVGRGEAVAAMHCPEDAQALSRAQKRLMFEELLTFMAAMGALKHRRQTGNAPCLSSGDTLQQFWQHFAYQPTDAQVRAAAQIAQDMASTRPMARLLQGDVGSGKTAVAAAAIAVCLNNGYQAALMAPTEILARQHAKSMQQLLGPSTRIVLLYGSQPAAERRAALAALADGTAQLAIGTHALIQPGVDYCRLGLVVTDEQHRFGVQQRQALADKGYNPHVLIMSATPIPRTLAFILYGDLDISLLDELPPGRQPIRTHVVLPHKHAGLWEFIRQEVQKGRQAYVVCPLVEDAEAGQEAASAEGLYEELCEGPLCDLRLGLLHGQLPAKQKDAVMQAFSQQKLDVLVCTTVIEVGVDVPNATLMAIEDADRFGLAQLHQLRGRVGRGPHQSYCFLCTARQQGSKRLTLLSQTADGFAIAEADLAMRGPGEVLGTRQSGLAQGQISGLAQDAQLLQQVSQAYSTLCLPDHQQALTAFESYATAYYHAAGSLT